MALTHNTVRQLIQHMWVGGPYPIYFLKPVVRRQQQVPAGKAPRIEQMHTQGNMRPRPQVS